MMSPLPSNFASAASAGRSKVRPLQKTRGLSVALLSSTSVISRACTRESRCAPEAVGVLHSLVGFRGTVRLANLAAFVEVRQVAGGGAGSGVRASVHDAGVEGAGAAAEGV